MKVLIDANVLLDVLAERKEYVAGALAVWGLAETKHIQAYVSSLSFSNVYYILRKATGRERALQAIHRIAAVFAIAAVDEGVVSRALATPLSDFEDALQCFAALTVGAEAVISRDQKGFEGAPILTMTPEELLAKLLTQSG
ncbi:MAG TPA: PIN domain-containing protein [Tepidisphaeraceae bacterium]